MLRCDNICSDHICAIVSDYTGVVTDYGTKWRVIVELTDKQTVTAVPDHILVVGGAGPCPVLSVGDYVLVRARSRNGPHASDDDESCDYYIPGTVGSQPEDLRKARALYSVLLFNNKGISCPRYGIIKIGRSRYQEACAFIREKASSRAAERSVAANGYTLDGHSQGSSIRIPSVHHSPHDHSSPASHSGSRAASLQRSRSHSGSRVSSARSHSGTRVSATRHSRSCSGSRVSTPRGESQKPAASHHTSEEMLKILEQQILQGELLEHQQRELSLVQLRHQDLEAELKSYKAKGMEDTTDSARSPLPSDVDTPASSALHAASPSHRQSPVHGSAPPTSPSHLLEEREGEEEEEVDLPVTTCEQAVNTDVMTEERGISTDPIMESRGVGTEWSDSGSSVLEDMPCMSPEHRYSPIHSFSPSPVSSPVHTPLATPPRCQSPPQHPETTPTRSLGLDHSGSLLESTPTRQLFSPEEVEEDPLINQHVLARWPDDGWYYRGLVVRHLQDMRYQVTDATQDIETIHAADIIIDLQDAQKLLQVGDTVAALHPSYDCSYAPGLVTGTIADGYHFTVELYDGTRNFLPRQEIYRLAPAKHTQDVGYLREKEEAWVGQVIVTRRERDGLYTQGKVGGSLA